MGRRSGEVVPAALSKGEKLLGHHRAHGVTTEIARPGLTRSIAIESGHRGASALFQGLAEYVLALRFLISVHPYILTWALTLLTRRMRCEGTRGNHHHDDLYCE
jgi:hypothetical protein